MLSVRDVALTGLLCVFTLVACAAGSDNQGKGPVLSDPEKADIGESIEAENWRLTLLGPSEKLALLGEGQIVYQAEGIFVVVPTKATNTGTEIDLLESGVYGTPVKVRDSQGREFRAVKSAPHVAYEMARGNVDLLFDSPLQAGKSVDGVLIFDVAKDAEGLEMMIGDESGSLRLGF